MNITCEWLRKAANDLKASDLLLEDGLYEESAFHAQQAVEKALKALLTAIGMQPPRTHSIERLLALLEEKIDVSWAYDNDLAALTYYAIETRYPGPSVAREEAEEALRVAKRTLEWVREQLSMMEVEC